MARAPSKHGRDQALKIGIVDQDRRSTGKTPSVDYLRSNAGQHEYLRNYDPLTSLSSSMTEENSPDAASEKEQGNEYFKQKKFKEAIDCYSRSIALSPTAVAYANRAIAYLKIRRFQEAEDDCSEALNLDDRYVKAYSRRATARRELRKLKESIEDSEFALRLEPHNQEIKKQHAETKSLLQKVILQKACGAQRSSVQGASVSGSQRTGTGATQEDHTKENIKKIPTKTSFSVEEVEGMNMDVENREAVQEVNGLRGDAVQSSGLGNQRTCHKDLEASVQDLASRAASRAMAEAANNITPPNSAYQFEVSWRALSGDSALQARFLKATSPNALPKIFKNALSAPLLVGIIRCLASFFIEEMDLAINYLENLSKVSRFDMIIMCLSSADKADILRIWNEVFCGETTPTEYANALNKLRLRYCPKC
ncbi:uncharacterized protein LOC131152895 isoform X2 [Malania oleifera]|uniref:uncharacterized protein LOC131152895 isoform X2 n=1 Tax=Malania oleifera TaxID=397392 RepID=UPI0025AEC5DE|nr:uncharacterized protein LOC131152895 isoform X2 [Malania oleifera]